MEVPTEFLSVVFEKNVPSLNVANKLQQWNVNHILHFTNADGADSLERKRKDNLINDNQIFGEWVGFSWKYVQTLIILAVMGLVRTLKSVIQKVYVRNQF